MTSLRIFFIGGLTSYRALFSWLSPWILIPTFIVGPIFQILFFAFVGRDRRRRRRRVLPDRQRGAVRGRSRACSRWATPIGGERQQTLPLLLVIAGPADPAVPRPGAAGHRQRLRRSSLVALARRGAAARRRLPPAGLAAARRRGRGVRRSPAPGSGCSPPALALRVRETAVLSNIVFGMLLIFCGVNVPRRRPARLDGGRRALAPADPRHRGGPAGRRRRRLGDVGGQLLTEAGLGILYVAVGLLMLAVLRTGEPAAVHARRVLILAGRAPAGPVGCGAVRLCVWFVWEARGGRVHPPRRGAVLVGGAPPRAAGKLARMPDKLVPSARAECSTSSCRVLDLLASAADRREGGPTSSCPSYPSCPSSPSSPCRSLSLRPAVQPLSTGTTHDHSPLFGAARTVLTRCHA